LGEIFRARIVIELPNTSLGKAGIRSGIIITHLKNVFWLNIFVGASFQILNIQQYASGLKLGPAAILNQNPIFQIGSKKNLV